MTTPEAIATAGTAAGDALQTFTAGHLGQILDGNVALEGFTNWPSPRARSRYKSGADKTNHNNTAVLYVNDYEVTKFAVRLDYEHAVAAHQRPPAI